MSNTAPDAVSVKLPVVDPKKGSVKFATSADDPNGDLLGTVYVPKQTLRMLGVTDFSATPGITVTISLG